MSKSKLTPSEFMKEAHAIASDAQTHGVYEGETYQQLLARAMVYLHNDAEKDMMDDGEGHVAYRENLPNGVKEDKPPLGSEEWMPGPLEQWIENRDRMQVNNLPPKPKKYKGFSGYGDVSCLFHSKKRKTSAPPTFRVPFGAKHK